MLILERCEGSSSLFVALSVCMSVCVCVFGPPMERSYKIILFILLSSQRQLSSRSVMLPRPLVRPETYGVWF